MALIPTTKNEAGRLVWEKNGVKITLDTNAGTYTMASKDGTTTIKLPTASQEAGFTQTINLGPLSMTVSSLGNGKFSFTTPIGASGTIALDFSTGQVTKIEASYKASFLNLSNISAELLITPKNLAGGIEFSTDVKLSFKLVGQTIFSDSRHYDVKAGNALEFVNLLGDGFKDTFHINDLLKLYNKNPDGTMKDITLPDGSVVMEGVVGGKFYSVKIDDSGVTELVYSNANKKQLVAKNWIDDRNFYQREEYSTDASGNKTTVYTDFADTVNPTLATSHTTTLVRADGTKQVRLDTDGDTTLEEQNEYTASNQLDNQRIYADNGSYTYLEHDQDNQYDWKTWNATWDAQGGYDYTQVTYDSGAKTHFNYDQTNGSSWNLWVTGWDPQGRIDFTQVTNDDGSKVHNEFDQANEGGWNTWITAWDAQGRYDYTQITYDSGIKSHYEVDQSNSGDWNTWTTNWDSQGRIDSVYVAFDDGGHSFSDYEADGSYDRQSWSRGGDYGWHEYTNGQSFGYDYWDHIDNTSQNKHFWKNKDLNTATTDYGWESFDDRGRQSWEIHKTYSFNGVKGEIQAWKTDANNYGWYFKSDSGKLFYEYVQNGQINSEHNLASPLNGANPFALYSRPVPTYVNSALYDIAA
jgi:hypothetical protein